MTTTRQFRRSLFGYRRRAVDEHLETVDAAIADLETRVSHATSAEHQDLVARSTRRSVDELVAAAEQDAVRIRAAAEADADRIRAEADREAVELLRDAYDLREASLTGDTADPPEGASPVIDLRADEDDEDAEGADETTAVAAAEVPGAEATTH